MNLWRNLSLLSLWFILLIFAGVAQAAADQDTDNTDNKVLDEFNAISSEEESSPAETTSMHNTASEHRTAINYTLQANRELLAPEKFHAKLGFNFQVAASLKNTMDNTILDFAYGMPRAWGWIELMAAKQTTTYARIGEHEQHPLANDPSLKTKNDSLILGIGATIVSDYPQELLGKWGRDIYATATSFLTYMSYKDKDWNQTYSGPGLKIEAGFHYRVSKLLHIGIKGFYYLNILKTKTNESNNFPKRITVAWPSVGIDVGYYF